MMGGREEINTGRDLLCCQMLNPDTSQNCSLKLGHNDVKSSILSPFSLSFQRSPFTAKYLMCPILMTPLLVWMPVTESQFKPVLTKSEIYQLNCKEKLRSQTIGWAEMQPSFMTAGAWRTIITRIILYKFSLSLQVLLHSSSMYPCFSPHLRGNVALPKAPELDIVQLLDQES